MNAQQLISRARSVTGRRIRYRLGGGSLDPQSPTPAGEDGSADCSAFVCWAVGLRKYQPAFQWLKKLNGGWFNTDGIWWDATCEATGYFNGAPLSLGGPSVNPRVVGQILVYPGAGAVVASGRALGMHPRIGHIGIVSKLSASGRVAMVIHCSSGNWRRHGDAIRETPIAEFGKLPETTASAWCSTIEP